MMNTKSLDPYYGNPSRLLILCVALTCALVSSCADRHYNRTDAQFMGLRASVCDP